MNIEIKISDLSFSEFTNLCSRLGELSFDELANFEIDKRATSNTIEVVPQQKAVKKQEQKVTQAKEKPAKEDKKPAPKKENPVDLKDALTKLATEKFANNNRTKELISILKEYGAKSLPELDKSHYQEIYERLKDA